MTLHLTNRTKHDVHILKRNTPLESFFADYLVVKKVAGKAMTPVAYQGPVAKRGVPTIKDYVHLAPGMHISQNVTLMPAYDVSLPGTYHVHWSGELLDAVIGNAPITLENPTGHRVSCRDIQFIRQ